MIKLKDLLLEDYDQMMRRKYGANKDYTNIEVKDIHFQTDPKEFEAMMSALQEEKNIIK